MKDRKKLIENAKKQPITDAVIDNDKRNKIGIIVIGVIILSLICFGIYWEVNHPDVKEDDKKQEEIVEE